MEYPQAFSAEADIGPELIEPMDDLACFCFAALDLAQRGERHARGQLVVGVDGPTDEIEPGREGPLRFGQFILLQEHTAERDVQAAHRGKLLRGSADDGRYLGPTLPTDGRRLPELTALVRKARLLESRLNCSVVVLSPEGQHARPLEDLAGCLRILKRQMRVA